MTVKPLALSSSDSISMTPIGLTERGTRMKILMLMALRFTKTWLFRTFLTRLP